MNDMGRQRAGSVHALMSAVPLAHTHILTRSCTGAVGGGCSDSLTQGWQYLAQLLHKVGAAGAAGAGVRGKHGGVVAVADAAVHRAAPRAAPPRHLQNTKQVLKAKRSSSELESSGFLVDVTFQLELCLAIAYAAVHRAAPRAAPPATCRNSNDGLQSAHELQIDIKTLFQPHSMRWFPKTVSVRRIPNTTRFVVACYWYNELGEVWYDAL